MPIRAGERVVMWYASANFDEDVFPDALRFDVGRQNGEVAASAAAAALLPRRVPGAARAPRAARGDDRPRHPYRAHRPAASGRSNFVAGIHSLPVRLTSGRLDTAAVDDLASLDIASPEVYEQGVPHEAFRLLRERDPVHWHPWHWSGAASGRSRSTTTSSRLRRTTRRTPRHSATSTCGSCRTRRRWRPDGR